MGRWLPSEDDGQRSLRPSATGMNRRETTAKVDDECDGVHEPGAEPSRLDSGTEQTWLVP